MYFSTIHQCADFLFFCLSGDQIDYYIGDNAHGDTFGNAVHERHCDDGDKAWNCLCHVTEINFCNRSQHQVTYNDQSRCCGKGRDCQEDR